MNWANLPSSMRARAQWVCANERKAPIDPKTGHPAEVDNPSTWATFKDATKAAIWNGWDIGYVLTEDDPFTIIDLDDKPHRPAPLEVKKVHADILQRADTYIERSVSGTGYHLVVTGKPSSPLKTYWVEQYGTRRMMVCTGDVIKRFDPADGSQLIDLIEKTFRHHAIPDVDFDHTSLPDWAQGQPVEDDSVIIEKCMNAENGDKFAALWAGDISIHHNDHSSSDAALLNMICFFTPHNLQVRRIFKQSGLYRPTQRNRQDAYMNRSIAKWRAENAPIDFATLKFPSLLAKPQAHAESHQIEVKKLANDLSVAPYEDAQPELDFPPGIIGDIARFCYGYSYRPIKEACIAASIAYVCGLMARGFHVDATGLNQYIIFLAASGVGKEDAKKAIRAINDCIINKIPGLNGVIGSGDYSSGIALCKELSANPCTLSLMGEIGQLFEIMLGPKAPPYLTELKKGLLEAWSESGPNGYLNPRKYSDRTKNVDAPRRPALSLLGESAPELFFRTLTPNNIVDGFVPRWLVFHYTGDRQSSNRNRQMIPPAKLIDDLSDIYVKSKSSEHQGTVTQVLKTDDAQNVLWRYEEHIDNKIRSLDKQSPMRAILNRTYEKSLRLAALFAVCENPCHPTITLELATSAIKIVERCDNNLLKLFTEGELGGNSGLSVETEYGDFIRKAIERYLALSIEQKITYKCPRKLVDHPIIPYSYIVDWCKRRNAFKSHPRGYKHAVKTAIDEAIELGYLVNVGPLDKKTLGLNQKLFTIGADLIDTFSELQS